jgi:hypothetical protein
MNRDADAPCDFTGRPSCAEMGRPCLFGGRHLRAIGSQNPHINRGLGNVPNRRSLAHHSGSENHSESVAMVQHYMAETKEILRCKSINFQSNDGYQLIKIEKIS